VRSQPKQCHLCRYWNHFDGILLKRNWLQLYQKSGLELRPFDYVVWYSTIIAIITGIRRRLKRVAKFTSSRKKTEWIIQFRWKKIQARKMFPSLRRFSEDGNTQKMALLLQLTNRIFPQSEINQASAPATAFWSSNHLAGRHWDDVTF